MLNLVEMTASPLTFASGDWWIPLTVLIVVALLFFLFLLRADKAYPYERIDSLCTKTELEFYWVLRKVVGDEFQIFGKTRIADLLKVRKGTKKRMSWQNRINCKHIDFVLCDPEDLSIQVAIELDDPSHNRPDRIQRDEFVNQAFDDAKLPILRIKTAETYDQKKIKSTIEKAISGQSRSFVFHIE